MVLRLLRVPVIRFKVLTFISVIHFLSVTALLVLIILKGTIFDSYYTNNLYPDEYPIIVYALGIGTILSVIASELKKWHFR